MCGLLLFVPVALSLFLSPSNCISALEQNITPNVEIYNVCLSLLFGCIAYKKNEVMYLISFVSPQLRTVNWKAVPRPPGSSSSVCVWEGGRHRRAHRQKLRPNIYDTKHSERLNFFTQIITITLTQILFCMLQFLVPVNMEACMWSTWNGCQLCTGASVLSISFLRKNKTKPNHRAKSAAKAQ